MMSHAVPRPAKIEITANIITINQYHKVQMLSESELYIHAPFLDSGSVVDHSVIE